ncbi:flagellar assembly protein FliX [Stappia indica]|uniref:flagellar assembly protein FliX n=1 Tax=Stappia indica TaxID=538381 RepID=UPI001CD7CAE2|nr:flagellar assembly protein FliX [Stappia indica]MCA1298831.1 flagellar assembly protein FliX [Stappia indica]
MRITGYTPTAGVAGRANKKRVGGSGSGFDLHQQEEASAAASGGAAAGIAGLDALLALQEVEDPLVGRRQAFARGHDLLDTLEAVKADLLGGRISSERLQRLAGLLERRKPSGDTALDGIVEEIELRARVELAKLGHFPG